MKFPHMVYSDEIVRQTQVRFGGYKHSLYANDGDIYDMRNITANIFPLITPRAKRSIVKPDSKIVLYKGNVYRYRLNNTLMIDPERSLYGMIEFGDKIQITGGANAGVYIASRYTNYNNEIFFITDKFTGLDSNTGDPTEQDTEITITRLARANKGSGMVYTTENTEVLQSDINDENTTYAFYNDDEHPDAYAKIIKKRTSQIRYRKKTTVETSTRVYEEPQTYSGVTLHQKMYSGHDCFLYKLSQGGTLDYTKFKVGNKLILSGDCPEDYKEPLIITKAGQVNSDYLYFKAEGTREDPLRDYPGLTLKIYNYLRTDVQTDVTTDPTVYTTPQDKTETTEKNGDVTTVTTVEYVFDGYDVTTVTEQVVYDYTNEDLQVESIGSGDKFYCTDTAGRFYYDNEYIGKLTPGKKSFAETGAFIFILPDRAYVNTNSKKIMYYASQTISQTDNYKIDTVDDNCITFGKSNLTVLTLFKAGDTVNVEFIYTDGKEQKATGTIESIIGSKITFTANVFSHINQFVQYLLKIKIYNAIPELNHICAANNRMWGCDDKTVYCSAFGAPDRWQYFETGAAGVADNSWSITPFDSSGDFTGCVTLGDKPIFFKENKVYIVYGSNPADFTLQAYDIPGTASGSAKSVTVIKDEAFYLSPEGVIRFSGGMSDNISGDFFEQLENGVAGTDGTRYYLSAQTAGGYKIFVFNTQNGKWCIEDEKEVSNYTMYKRRLFMLSGNEINCVNPGELPYPIINSGTEDDKESFIEFGDYYCDSPDKKAVSKLYLRFTIEQGGTVEIDINYDSEKNESGRVWNVIKTLSPGGKKSYVLPIIPRRADHFRIRIKGRGFVLYSLSHEYYSGTAL